MAISMDISLLATKFHFPIARQPLVSRPRLIEHLKQGLRGPLVLISGSAGSGKTTLLSEWHVEAGGGEPALWLSLDDHDNDIQVFLAYLAAALDDLQPGLKETVSTLLDASTQPEYSVILTTFINTLNSIRTDFVLVIDDYHVITNADIHAAVSFLIENSPNQMHIVILTRIDPPLPLARLRSRGCLVELRDNELRFNLDEAALFFKEIMQLPITNEQVAALESRTEGWVAGLQMAALSMRDRQDLSGFVSAFAGSHRFIIDYLAEEVLNRQTQDVRDFLLKTSILERLSADLCNTLTGRSDSQAVLERLENANLFIIPLDDHRRWYRYHHLFADLLRNYLKQALPNHIVELHHKASQWYEEQNYMENALAHAAAIPDYGMVENILCNHALSMIDHGYTRLVNHWLKCLPTEVLEDNPVLGLCMSICAHHVPPRDTERSEEWLQKAEGALAKPCLEPKEAEKLREKIAANRINLARMADARPETILVLIKNTLARYPDIAPRQLAFIYFNEAEAHLCLHDLRAAEQAFKRIQALGPLADDPYDYLAGTAKLVDLYAQQGHLDKAKQLCETALGTQAVFSRDSTTADPVYGLIDAYYGDILLISGELEKAKEYLELGYKRLSATAEIAVQARALINLTRLAIWQGNWAAADSLMGKIQRLQSEYHQPAEILAWLRKSECEPNAMSEVMRILEEHPFLADAQVDLTGVLLRGERRFYALMIQAYARIVLFGEKYVPDIQPVLDMLQTQSAFAKLHGWKIRLTQLLIINALALQALGDVEQASKRLCEAVDLAQAFRGKGVFQDFGIHLQNLLRRASLKFPARVNFANQILASIFPAVPIPAKSVPIEALIEPLTEREQDVLRLMAAGLSNPEIAQELYLGLNTIKTHTRGIYGKLGVNNRTQATVRARELGLI
jgi:LuxR family maltose regulon positive regulatory protein